MTDIKDARTAQRMKRALKDFYAQYDPSRVQNVESLFSSYTSAEIGVALHKKYRDVPVGWEGNKQKANLPRKGSSNILSAFTLNRKNKKQQAVTRKPSSSRNVRQERSAAPARSSQVSEASSNKRAYLHSAGQMSRKPTMEEFSMPKFAAPPPPPLSDERPPVPPPRNRTIPRNQPPKIYEIAEHDSFDEDDIFLPEAPPPPFQTESFNPPVPREDSQPTPPDLSRYQKMLDIGQPEGAVVNALVRDGHDESLIHQLSVKQVQKAPKPKPASVRQEEDIPAFARPSASSRKIGSVPSRTSKPTSLQHMTKSKQAATMPTSTSSSRSVAPKKPMTMLEEIAAKANAKKPAKKGMSLADEIASKAKSNKGQSRTIRQPVAKKQPAAASISAPKKSISTVNASSKFAAIHAKINQSMGGGDTSAKPAPIKPMPGGVSSKFGNMHKLLAATMGGGPGGGGGKPAVKKVDAEKVAKLQGKFTKKSKLPPLVVGQHDDLIAKYKRMKKMRLPDGAITNAVEKDGFDGASFFTLGDAPAAQSTTPAASEAPAPVQNKPVQEQPKPAPKQQQLLNQIQQQGVPQQPQQQQPQMAQNNMMQQPQYPQQGGMMMNQIPNPQYQTNPYVNPMMQQPAPMQLPPGMQPAIQQQNPMYTNGQMMYVQQPLPTNVYVQPPMQPMIAHNQSMHNLQVPMPQSQFYNPAQNILHNHSMSTLSRVGSSQNLRTARSHHYEDDYGLDENRYANEGSQRTLNRRQRNPQESVIRRQRSDRTLNRREKPVEHYMPPPTFEELELEEKMEKLKAQREGWSKEWSNKYERYYYFNKYTNESTWEAPPGF